MLHYGTMSDIWKTQQEADFPGNYQGTKLLDITTQTAKRKKSWQFSKRKINKMKLKSVRHKNNYREQIDPAIMNEPDKNVVNLLPLNLTSPKKFLLMKTNT